MEQAEGKTCPVCGQGILRQRAGKTVKFWSCNRYPDCKSAYPDKGNQPDLTPPVACPVCQKGVLRQRSGKNGTFWSCSNSPDCRATFDDREELLIL
ncbi:DNA topoisomerase family protein [Anaerospora hongkongensis]|uniref:DNA topoisomerase family protein n=1 Tax=Anaerospora hongkongensis TaxID=244830 RepID=UPI0035E3C476